MLSVVMKGFTVPWKLLNTIKAFSSAAGKESQDLQFLPRLPLRGLSSFPIDIPWWSVAMECCLLHYQPVTDHSVGGGGGGGGCSWPPSGGSQIYTLRDSEF